MRGTLAAAGGFALLRRDPTGALGVAAWSAVALGAGSELLASAAFLLRRG